MNCVERKIYVLEAVCSVITTEGCVSTCLLQKLIAHRTQANGCGAVVSILGGQAFSREACLVQVSNVICPTVAVTPGSLNVLIHAPSQQLTFLQLLEPLPHSLSL